VTPIAPERRLASIAAASFVRRRRAALREHAGLGRRGTLPEAGELPGPSMTIDGVRIRDQFGMYEDGWCARAASFRACPTEASTAVGFDVWLKREPDQPAAARFAVQIDRGDPFVFELPFDKTVRIVVPCERVAGTPFVVSMLCDVEVSDKPGDSRPISFRLGGISLTNPEGDTPARTAAGTVLAWTPGGETVTRGARIAPPPPDPLARFVARREPPRAALERLQRHARRRLGSQLLSIVMPVHNTRHDWLRTAIDSVRSQWAPNWELICVDDGSSDGEVPEILERYALADDRIRVIRSAVTRGTAAATNVGLAATAGEFVAFLDHDDYLEPTAVGKMLDATCAPDVDLVYSDEVLTTADIDEPIAVAARPAFSHDYYLDHPYFVHFVACRRSLAVAVGGFDEEMRISADVDFVLRVLERASIVAHVPAVLYRWRTHDAGLGHQRKDEVTSATIAALNRSLCRLSLPATAAPGLGFNQYRTEWRDPRGRVLIVIPTKNGCELLRRAVESIELTCQPGDYKLVVIDHASDEPATQAYLASLAGRHLVERYEGAFNFSAMNNAAVRTFGAGCAYVLFMNNDVEAIAPRWLERLRSLAARRDVGAVCPLLLYGRDEPGRYNRVQHGGVIVGFNGSADHAFKNVPAFGSDGRSRTPGHNCSLNVAREFSAVTAACLMLRREAFDAVGGFDGALVVGFNDTDLCLRLGACGYRILYDGHTVLYHRESATRRPANMLVHEEDSLLFVRRWAAVIERGDDFYNPLLASAGVDHAPAGRTSATRSRDVRYRRAGFDWSAHDAG